MHKPLSYTPNTHIAFPLGFGDMKSQRAMARTLLKEKGLWRSVCIEAIAYDAYTKKEAERGGALDRIFPGITASLGRKPDDEAPWLYRVTSFTEKAPATGSLILLPGDEDDLHADWFDDFHAALAHCRQQFGLEHSDFKRPAANSL